MRGKHKQQGISLVGLILAIAVLSMVGLLAAQVLPTYTEYRAIVSAVAKAKAEGTTPQEIMKAFDKSAEVNYISSISGKDLLIERVDGGLEVSFAYDRKIPLVGPASLLLEYTGSTSKSGQAAAKPQTE
jgi:hypothetical protein